MTILSVHEIKSLLPELCHVIRQAGKTVMDVYESDFTVYAKKNDSPVTEADMRAEGVILSQLEDLTPNIPIVAEEAMTAGREPDTSGGTFWLVDPLDGTKEFINRNGEFTVNIALVQNNAPLMGLVYAPVLDELYTARGPGSALLEKGGETFPISCRKIPEDGATVVASRSHGDETAVKDFLKDHKIKEIVSCGSSLKFCTVASGKADFYPRLGPTMEWDTAAAQAVLVAAGGRVETIGGERLSYGKKDFKNPYFVAYGA